MGDGGVDAESLEKLPVKKPPNQVDVGMETLDVVSRKVFVANELGLHARPAARLAREAQKYSSRITLLSQEQEVDAKSILDLLTLALGPGCAVELKAQGEDAQSALEQLEQLFLNRFEEER
ncbi:phosphocarrier protein [Desulfonatronum zhilinae]|nr:phosphocarrier protein [Desulfonatronum zhilinae]